LTAIERPADPDGGDAPLHGAVRYVVAQAAKQLVAFRVDAVREVIPARAPTRLPGADAWVLGLLNLRGTVLTVVDLTVRFGGTSATGASIVVLEVEGRTFGVQVERVLAVTDVADALLTPVEDARSAGGLARAIAPVDGGTAMVLDVVALRRAALADA
jgi:purine-binding chemotaxis protein CheW